MSLAGRFQRQAANRFVTVSQSSCEARCIAGQSICVPSLVGTSSTFLRDAENIWRTVIINAATIRSARSDMISKRMPSLPRTC